MKPIDPEEWAKRLARMTDIFTGIVNHANELATQRCPYKNKDNRCTAKFGCRNQRRPPMKGELLVCGGDDKLNYRFAWEDTPVDTNHNQPEQ